MRLKQLSGFMLVMIPFSNKSADELSKKDQVWISPAAIPKVSDTVLTRDESSK